jgi:glycosyltransferase involved in cell wall biosynthesis
MNKRVAVIMPIYNGLRGKGGVGQNILRQAIDSIIEQTVYDLCQFVIIDDGSTDRSFWVIQEYARKHAEIEILHFTDNFGVAHALNAGINHISNDDYDYMCMQGADDISHPERVETMMNWLDEHPLISMAGCWSEGINWEGTEILTRICDTPQRHEILYYDMINGMLDKNVRFPMVRWDVGKSVGWFDEINFPSRAQDADFLLRVAEKYKVGIVPDVLYRYRMPANDYKECLSYDVNSHSQDLVRALSLSEYRRNKGELDVAS